AGIADSSLAALLAAALPRTGHAAQGRSALAKPAGLAASSSARALVEPAWSSARRPRGRRGLPDLRARAPPAPFGRLGTSGIGPRCLRHAGAPEHSRLLRRPPSKRGRPPRRGALVAALADLRLRPASPGRSNRRARARDPGPPGALGGDRPGGSRCADGQNGAQRRLAPVPRGDSSGQKPAPRTWS